MKTTTYWWARLSPWMKSALLAGVLCLLIVAGSVVSFYLLPSEWHSWIVVVGNGLTAIVALLAALLTLLSYQAARSLPSPRYALPSKMNY